MTDLEKKPMNWAQLGHVILDSAPVLASAIGGPYAGIVGNLIAKAFGSEATPSSVLAAMTNDPHAPDKLKTIEDTHSCWIGLLDKLKTPSQVTITFTINFN